MPPKVVKKRRICPIKLKIKVEEYLKPRTSEFSIIKRDNNIVFTATLTQNQFDTIKLPITFPISLSQYPSLKVDISFATILFNDGVQQSVTDEEIKKKLTDKIKDSYDECVKNCFIDFGFNSGDTNFFVDVDEIIKSKQNLPSSYGFEKTLIFEGVISGI
jgi:hypothetical protein